MNDLYLLTLPAFHWIKVQSDTSQDSKEVVNQGRFNHLCASQSERQMIVVGGRNVDDFKQFSCDPRYSQIKLLDTSTFQWQTQYPLKNTTYQVPKIVTDIIGGGPDGGAKPASAWAQTLGDTVNLFSKTIPKYNPPQMKILDSSNRTSGSNTTPGSTQDSSGSTLGPGIISGIVVGTAGGMIIMGVAVYLIMAKRRRHRRQETEAVEADWQKPELSSGHSSKPSAGIPQSSMVEAEGDDPVKLIPKELTAHCRSELPSTDQEESAFELSGGYEERNQLPGDTR